MPPKGWRKPIVGDTEDPDGLVAWVRRYVDALRVRGYSDRTLVTTRGCLLMFVEWAFCRGINRPDEITKPIIEHYQRAMFEVRKPDGRPLTLSSQRVRLQKLRGFFKWMAKTEALPFNPASEVELPRVERRLPRSLLNEKEVEQVLALPDLDTPTGLRDRAMMEILYSTGIRRAELTALRLGDIDGERGTLIVRLGKGKKDRVVPIGERALLWLDRYVDEVRSSLVVVPDKAVIFLTNRGTPLDPMRLTNLMRRYIQLADLGKTGACHIFRHAMATLMLERGADIRIIQEILGHAELSTTEIYTRVSIGHLKAIHDKTHPGAKLQKPRSRIRGNGSRADQGSRAEEPDDSKA